MLVLKHGKVWGGTVGSSFSLLAARSTVAHDSSLPRLCQTAVSTSAAGVGGAMGVGGAVGVGGGSCVDAGVSVGAGVGIVGVSVLVSVSRS